MRIILSSVFVDDQDKALAFYTGVLGFIKKNEMPVGADRWLTVVSRQAPDGPELVLEPDSHPAARSFKRALYNDGVPVTAFGVADVRAEVERLRALGVRIVTEPVVSVGAMVAVIDDTCGNLIQLAGVD